MRLNIVSPGRRSVFEAFSLFVSQMGLFALAAALLFEFYNPVVSVPDDMAWNFSYGLYGYTALEALIFIIVTALSFSVFMSLSRMPGWKTPLLLLTVEIAFFVAIDALSTLYSVGCGGLFSSFHHPILGKPNCGVSSVNFTTPWFAVFSVLTLCTWTGMLAKGRDFTKFTFTAERSSVLPSA